MRLTKAQIWVLELLSVSPRETTRTTHHGYVSGATATALLKRGLAKYESRQTEYGRFVEITPAGRVALVILKEKAADIDSV